MESVKPVRRAPYVLCQTCLNWTQTRGHPAGCCAAGIGATTAGWTCDHYVRVFRPLPFHDRRKSRRDGPDRRKAP